MLSPRTLSLRTKSRALLKALDHCLDAANQNFPMDNEIDGNGRIDGKLAPTPNGSPFSYSGQDIQDTSTNLWDDSEMSYVTNPNSSPGQKKMPNDHILSDDMNSFVKKDGGCLIKPITTSSVDDLKSIIREAEMEIHSPEKSVNSRSIIKKNCMRRSLSESKVRTRNTRPISVEQQRSADSQMHAPTHSHLMSKCYCTQTRNAKSRSESKYVVQLYGLKQHLPPRLKKQRYRTASLPRDSRNVRWADKYDHISINSSKSKDIELKSQYSEPSEVMEGVVNPHNIPAKNHLAFCHHQLPTNLLERVKTFRESHWSDCHALPGASTNSTDHECVQHYVLNDRLYLEPVHRDDRGESSCPVCPQASFKMNRISPLNTNSHVLVTLPKVILGSDHGHREPEIYSASHLDNSRRGTKQKSCFLIRHHAQTAREKSPHPTDSLALKYQKKP